MNKIFLRRLFVSSIGLLCLLAWTEPVADEVISSHLDAQEEIIRQRIPTAVTIVTPTYNPAVRSYLNTYIYRRPDHTSAMLGWAAVYFPMFEKALADEGLPTDLKYLSIVESALNPTAISRSGAGGLWQFMKPTARECGLKISSYVDERMDPEKSTKAAVKYLKQLYGMFGNWELVMAAYNAGPGRVRSAIKRAGTNDYWKMSRFLPAETQSYVPGFIAASYLVHFHDAHNLIPVYPELAMGDMVSVSVFEGMSITEVARRSGLTVDEVKRLNPCYVRNYVPASPAGHILVLPYTAAELFNSRRSMDVPEIMDDMIASNKTITLDGQTYKITVTSKEYVVRSGDNLYAIAQRHKCSVRELMLWNGLRDSRLAIGQRLEIRHTIKELLPAVVSEALAVPTPPIRQTFQVSTLPALGLNTLPTAKKSDHLIFTIAPTEKETLKNTIVLQRRQSIRQALYQHPDGPAPLSSCMLPAHVCAGDVVRLK